MVLDVTREEDVEILTFPKHLRIQQTRVPRVPAATTICQDEIRMLPPPSCSAGSSKTPLIPTSWLHPVAGSVGQ